MRPGHVCPGKPPEADPYDAGARASMRPGHVCPGKRWGARTPARFTKSFNEAGACLPRKEAALEAAYADAGASMRPGHVCPGNG